MLKNLKYRKGVNNIVEVDYPDINRTCTRYEKPKLNKLKKKDIVKY
jgi:hypothetical protein